MMVENDYFSFKKLEWDTSNLGINTYELSFKKDITKSLYPEIEALFEKKSLVYIKNPTMYRLNSEFIGEKTKAVLFDTNVSFLCTNIFEDEIDLNNYTYKIDTTIIINSQDFNRFSFSRFYVDERWSSKSKLDIYDEWIKNSLNVNNKKFIVIEKNNETLGYILFKLDDKSYTIELISVRQNYQNMKIGSKLIAILKNYAYKNNIHEIRVGTQISNIKALNFYIKNGFYVNSTSDIYHYWM